MKCHQNYYKNVSWNGIQTNSVNFKDADSLWKTLKELIINEYNLRGLWQRVQDAMDTYENDRTFRNFHEICVEIAHYALMGYLAFYVLWTLQHIFILPCYTLWIMGDDMNVYQGCFIMMYFALLVYIVYKLWELLRYEMIMWYVIPDLQYLRCTQDDVNAFKNYYKYIRNDRFEIEDALTDSVGIDVAKLIMLYLPDFIALYQERLYQEEFFFEFTIDKY